MTDIVEFLTARLDEREQLARGVEHAVGDQYDALTAAMGMTYGLSMVSLYWRSHGPARVLAEAAAQRAIMDLYEAARISSEVSTGTVLAGATRLNLRAYGNVLHALAAVYNDHPDYDPTWNVNAT